MKKTWGIFLVFVLVFVITALMNENFLSAVNLQNLVMRLGLYGIMAIGVSFVIMTGGIDLSLGSMVCLTGCGLPWLLTRQGMSPASALSVIVVVTLAIGFAHGLMITKWRLQPFIVTLCGLLIYRGVMRGVASDQSVGFGNQYQDLRWLATGKVPLEYPAYVIAAVMICWVIWSAVTHRGLARGMVLLLLLSVSILAAGVLSPAFQLPVPFLIMLVIAGVASIFLNRTVWGQHLLALGNHEEAARYSGIRTHRLIIASYVICSLMAGFAGVLHSMDVNSSQPSDFGNFYELYAIAAAVLGGCSLRGGQGAVLGVLIGTALMLVLQNMIVLEFSRYQNMEFAVIGIVILLGVMGDEVFKRFFARKLSEP